MIAHESSAAYEDIFTLSYVSGRSVGIGAYLVRLGQRIIQKTSSPIILTGFNALNKVLGRTVYTSNLQVCTCVPHCFGVAKEFSFVDWSVACFVPWRWKHLPPLNAS